MIGKIRISDLRAAAAERPAGYLDEILSAGRLEDGVLHIEHATYFALRRKFIPKNHTYKGVGIELKKLLDKLGLKPASGCRCNQHILVMNQNGVEWCKQNVDIILDWLREEAQRANLPFIKICAWIIVKRAIRNAIKKSAYPL